MVRFPDCLTQNDEKRVADGDAAATCCKSIPGNCGDGTKSGIWTEGHCYSQGRKWGTGISDAVIGDNAIDSCCGPTTLAAMLNSLQMGFKTLAIQKRSSEVWEVLAGVKKEFSNFGTVLEKAQRKIKEADNEIEKMVTTRTRMMLSKLRKVEQIEPTESEEEKQEDDLFKLK